MSRLGKKPEITTCVDESGETVWFVAKGHLSVDEFMAALQKRNEAEGDVGGFPLPWQVEYEIVRLVPVHPSLGLPWKMQYHLSKPGRGAFEITFWNLE